MEGNMADPTDKTCTFFLQVYPVSIGVAERGFSKQMKGKEVMKRTLQEIQENDVRIRHFVLDSPKRCGE
jgi:hypothetical protein